MSKESAYFQLSSVGKRDAKELKRQLDAFHGVISVSVNTEQNTLAVDYDNTGISCGRLEQRLRQLGYPVESCQTEQHRM